MHFLLFEKNELFADISFYLENIPSPFPKMFKNLLEPLLSPDYFLVEGQQLQYSHHTF